jgi:RES domain-containing protein
MVYTAQSLSLAQLELLVHLEVEDVLRGHWRYFPLEVAPEAILACESWAALPPDYASWPAPASTRAIGDRWIVESLSVGLSVPSAITPGERNLLLNPAHPGYAAALAIGDPVGLILDRRLIKSAARPPTPWPGRSAGATREATATSLATYPVAGPWQESGFVLETAEGPRSACRSSTCDWYADHADLERGTGIETTTFPLIAQTTAGEALQAALAPLAGHGTLYLLGTFEAPGSRAVPPTVEAAGERVTLHNASPEALDAWRGRSLRDLDLAVQVRHAPGETPPAPLSLAGAGPQVHPLLDRWLR